MLVIIELILRISDLVGVEATPSDTAQREYLDRVASDLSKIENNQFRKNWLNYQMCKIDITQFFKKIKLVFRGSR